MKKILFLTHRVPYPPDRGDRIRAYQLLRFLSGRAKVWLASTADEPIAPNHYLHLTELCEEVSIHRIGRYRRWMNAASSVAFRKSATEGLFASQSMKRSIRFWSEQVHFDAAVVYCSSMGQYLRHIRQRPGQIVLDLVDLDSQKWRDYSDAGSGVKKWLYRLESKRVHRLERNLAQAADRLTLISDHEVSLFEKQHHGHCADVLSNGVDSNYFHPDSLPVDEYAELKVGFPQMVFVGVLNYHPNVEGMLWFCKELWPLIRQRWPKAHLDIVGRNPTKEIMELQNLERIRVVGPVADVRPYMLSADFSIAPLRIARGVQNKVLEALAIGKPVIASPQAATGIDPMPGLLQVDLMQEWMDSIESLQDREHCEQLGQSARSYIDRHYSWESKLRPLAQFLELESLPDASSPS